MATSAGARVESGAGKGGKQGDDTGGFTELFRINQVLYRMPPVLSIVSKRTLLQNFFAKNTYSNFNETMFCTFSTGEFYVAPKTSYLYIEIGFKDPLLSTTVNAYTDAFAAIGAGDVTSLFYEPLFFASSGTEICRETEKGLISRVESMYKYDNQYKDTIGQIQGMPRGKYSEIWDGAGATGDIRNPFLSAGGSIMPPIGAPARNLYGKGLHSLSVSQSPASTNAPLASFVIPMNKIMGLFAPYNDCLIPAGMLAGSRFELRMKDPVESLFFTGLCNNNYHWLGSAPAHNPNLAALIAAARNLQVTNIYFVFDAFQLQDAVIKRLNETAAGQDGLSLLFDTHDYTPYSTLAGQFEAQVSQARSRVVRSICVVRDQQNIVNPYIDSMASEPAVYRISSRLEPGVGDNFGNIYNGGGTQLSGNSATDTPWGKTAINGLQQVLTVGQFNNYTGGVGTLPPTNVINYSADGKTTLSNVTTLTKTIVAPHPADKFITGNNLTNTPTVTSYQAQLGSLFFPQQPLKTAKEYYFNALYMYGKSLASKDMSCCVDYDAFLGGYGWNQYGTDGTAMTTYGAPDNKLNHDPTYWTSWSVNNFPYIFNYGMAVYGALFEKNQLLEMSGLPVSNARLLRHKFQFGDSTSLSGAGRRIDVYTTFTRAVKVFLGGLCVVRE